MILNINSIKNHQNTGLGFNRFRFRRKLENHENHENEKLKKSPIQSL